MHYAAAAYCGRAHTVQTATGMPVSNWALGHAACFPLLLLRLPPHGLAAMQGTEVGEQGEQRDHGYWVARGTLEAGGECFQVSSSGLPGQTSGSADWCWVVQYVAAALICTGNPLSRESCNIFRFCMAQNRSVRNMPSHA
ncbi:hypothetical protein NDU88_003496 [Pleurodeles waltl]|uniref:Uncharacterized protein n=1 Tax=Pleurodeles waltl TaxID=8319 RepID=A0AAV7QFJ9_PLEWA|nr:hypothetical protein NDU88_003496 [Pleurodeles waltl]